MRSKRLLPAFLVLPSAILIWILASPSQDSPSAPEWEDADPAAPTSMTDASGSFGQGEREDPRASGDGARRASPATDTGSVDSRGDSDGPEWDPGSETPDEPTEEDFGRLGRMTDRIADLLYEGTVTPAEILDRIRAESDPDVVDALFAALQEAEDVLDGDAAALAAWLDLARTDPDPAKRASAIGALGLLADPDGTIRATLLDLARRDSDEDARFAALGALLEYVDAHPEGAGEVARAGLEIARSSGNAPEIRAEALAVVDPYYLDSSAVGEVGTFLADPAADVRFVAAEVLGRARAQDRQEVLGLLETSYRSEADADVRAAAVESIVRAGRHESLDVLRKLAPTESDPALAAYLEDYVAVLETGEVDTDRIDELLEERLDQRLERARATPDQDRDDARATPD
ncbi:MAG: HEAT repeat domain-containing protein, partial [Planctomycetes bacterium]|nr:HEAT repeat domain-containing protein [Planctomycetota bacterium]